ncbi:MAG: hypothetical protein JEZ00_15840 [Anaerolineaceae bacterium]|nr:hypothetical protein [Anaerolineaceae bacterium]
MDIGNRFSLEDFLAYFFPGVTGALGIYVLIQMTPMQSSLPSLTADFSSGFIFFVLSYIAGILFSSFAELAFSKIKSHKDEIPLNNKVKEIITKTFRETFKISKDTTINWSKDHFYLCRSVVYERMPSILSLIQRQSSLRQLRINLLPALFIWLLVGIGWGVQSIDQNAIVPGKIIIVMSVLIYIIFSAITINRARSNEQREVREVLTAFGASYKKNQENDKTKNHKG